MRLFAVRIYHAFLPVYFVRIHPKVEQKIYYVKHKIHIVALQCIYFILTKTRLYKVIRLILPLSRL